jgi:hypothetical protein
MSATDANERRGAWVRRTRVGTWSGEHGCQVSSGEHACDRRVRGGAAGEHEATDRSVRRGAGSADRYECGEGSTHRHECEDGSRGSTHRHTSVVVGTGSMCDGHECEEGSGEHETRVRGSRQTRV